LSAKVGAGLRLICIWHSPCVPLRVCGRFGFQSVGFEAAANPSLMASAFRGMESWRYCGRTRSGPHGQKRLSESFDYGFS